MNTGALLVAVVLLALLTTEVLCKVTNPHQVLGIKNDAPLAEIKKAYKQLALKCINMLTNEDVKFKFSPPFSGTHGISIELNSGHIAIIFIVIAGIIALKNVLTRSAAAQPKRGEFVQASLFTRIIAGLIDIMLFNSNYATLREMATKLLDGNFKAAANSYTPLLLLSAYIFFLYKGKSLGKWMLGVKVVDFGTYQDVKGVRYMIREAVSKYFLFFLGI